MQTHAPEQGGRAFGWPGLLGRTARQVRLLVQQQECGHAQAAPAQQLHAALRGLRVVHDDEVQRAGRRGRRHVVPRVDCAQVACGRSAACSGCYLGVAD